MFELEKTIERYSIILHYQSASVYQGGKVQHSVMRGKYQSQKGVNFTWFLQYT